MQIDTDHLHHWMRAIRNSKDPIRTMDAFWKGQISSKEWLIKNLEVFIENPVTVDIHGGWVGTLASLLFQSNLGYRFKHIRNIDIDPTCQDISITMNQIEMEQGRFSAITADMCSIQSAADVIINTSCEHISQLQYDFWLGNLPIESLIVLQSNDYNIPEHVRTASSLDEFISQSGLTKLLFSDKLELPLYNRWMLIGKK